MLDVPAARQEVHRFLESLGWKTNTTQANYTREGHALEFKVGTSYGEVAVHIRHGRDVVDIVRILSEEKLHTALRQLEDLMDESILESAMSES